MHNSFSYIMTGAPVVLCLLSLIFYWRASSNREEGREEIKRERKKLQEERYINESFQERDRKILNEDREKLTLQEKRLNEERAQLATKRVTQYKALKQEKENLAKAFNQSLEEAREVQEKAIEAEQESKKKILKNPLRKKETHTKKL